MTGPNEYQKVRLIESHYEFSKFLEQKVGQIIPNVNSFIDNKFGFIAQETYIVGLALYGVKLATFPENIERLTTLQMLNLSGNDLSTIPMSIGQLLAFRELDLNDNLLASLPENMNQLSSLIGRIKYLGGRSFDSSRTVQNSCLVS